MEVENVNSVELSKSVQVAAFAGGAVLGIVGICGLALAAGFVRGWLKRPSEVPTSIS